MGKKTKETVALHPSLEQDKETGLFNFKPTIEPLKPVEVYTADTLKFNSDTRWCPVHGTQEVVSRNLQARRFVSVEGLECGHTVLITRETKGKKNNTRYPLDDKRSLRFLRWRLHFIPTTCADYKPI